ncbi:MAG: 50S ribosomal protein L3 N(5)-glutamine methyltransferase [Endozoicomonadaceae bacterium]|nr:50S ribosomal protein L3 N(5)-glutamine methyltransferase [Endozoicomonadaceae bacterium]
MSAETTPNLTDHSELKTIRDWLRWAYSRFNEAPLFYGHGFKDSWNEVIFLVLRALNLPWDIDNEFYDSRVTKTEAKQLYHLIEQRIVTRKPLAYLLNEAWFCSMPFYVNEKVLIPRSPIAELIEKNFSPWLKEDVAINHILDMCCGSGCIGIACATHYPHAEVDMADISHDALEVSATNIEKHQLQGRVNLIRSDLFSALYKPEHNKAAQPKKYQLIISNPPYVSTEEMTNLPMEYYHEPTLGFVAEEEGLDIVHKLLQQSVDFIDDNGLLVMEVGNNQHKLEERYPDVPFTWVNFERGGYGIFILTAEQCHTYFGKDKR